MNTFKRMLRGAEATHPHWVVLSEERCIGENFFLLRNFCEERGLSVSRHGRPIPRREGYYQVFMFAEAADAHVFSKEFGGERMRARERHKPRKLGVPKGEQLGLTCASGCFRSRDFS